MTDKKPESKRATLHMRVSDSWKERLEREAKEAGELPSEYVRSAVEQRWNNNKAFGWNHDEP